MDAVEDYLENCAQEKVDIEVVQSLLKPEILEVSPKYILKHSTRRGSNSFRLFDTSEKPNHFVACRRRWLGGEKRCTGKRVGKTSGMILSIQELWQKPRVPRQDRTNAVAAAKFAVSQRRRRPLGLD